MTWVTANGAFEMLDRDVIGVASNVGASFGTKILV